MSDKPASIALGSGAGMPRAARVLFSVLSRLRQGRLHVIAPGGQRHSFPGPLPGPDALLELTDWSVCDEILRSGDLGFAEAYLQGRWSTPDLAALLTLVALNHAALEDAVYDGWWGKLLHRLRHCLRANTRAGRRRNIHARYDLGNDFYQSWLDQTMTYSSALFSGALDRTLEEAQLAKYERILSILSPAPDSRILEIGCGWGGFAEYAARTRRCRVNGITISRGQLEYARNRIAQAGLAERVDLAFRDYRDVRGRFDYLVSIEMYETVGRRFWPTYFRVVRDRLVPGGRAVLQAITIAEERFECYRPGTDFIQQYIFPGGMLASPSVFRGHAQRAGLAVHSVYSFGMDYAETLRRWTVGFNRAWGEIRFGAFDERFKRLWNFYLCYCEAGFRAGTTDVFQVELSRG